MGRILITGESGGGRLAVTFMSCWSSDLPEKRQIVICTVHVLTLQNTIKIAQLLPAMIARKKGAIINIASLGNCYLLWSCIFIPFPCVHIYGH